MRCAFSIVLMVCAGLMAGCAAGPEGWDLAFQDTFDRQELGENWEELSGEWMIEDGRLVGKGEILCLKGLPGNQRLEFDCQAKEDACDLTGILVADESGFASGYFFGFGSEYNAYSKLLVAGVEVQQHDALIVPGKTHHVVCQSDDGKLTHIVDGKTVLQFEDPQPIQGPDQQRIGFYVYSWGQIDNVRVYTKPHKKPAQ